MKKIRLSVLVLMTAFSLTTGAKDYSGSKKMKMMDLTAEQRETMAAQHEKLAACLRSGKPMAECREEMMGVEDCPMMGMRHSSGMKEDSGKKRTK